ncbi:hypothetical protein VOLCADRAFT_85849 [Volvox carteri f. nagariensis]|uniref:Transmembrane protein n=1 Tax=Volvox carteri f. nagariensis TaxID=3068 RepID=D8TH56_VOLCA|nr:uncharacterized protein VOLCADRAFT_85849 [Volvox carteri f. nagariensis]EFJ53012.1 hypothetical protein VOLCADRAFT_85849 [Volvox carteri f. nagariensis]|eukprot:XP_002946017.1 hypothetical protein VOLCADRAFT_85849 [Volvox carteri f. nagariensis]
MRYKGLGAESDASYDAILCSICSSLLCYALFLDAQLGEHILSRTNCTETLLLQKMQVSTFQGGRASRFATLYRSTPHRHVCVQRRMVRAEPEGKPDSSFESLFSKELQRRGLSSVDDEGSSRPAENAGSSSSGSTGPFAGSGGSGPTPGANPFASSSGPSSSTRTRPRSAPPPKAADAEGDQRQKSMDLVNEGLEGLIPRAKVLLQLGGSVFLGFLPFMIVFSLLFTGVYSVFGTNFVHGGREMMSPPTYIDPERLLSEPTVDPYVPYNNNPYSSPDLR